MTDQAEETAKNPNPIDPDKITEFPHSIDHPHTIGSAIIKPEDKGKIKGNALSAMAQQTEQQLGQLYQQMQVLAEQAKAIQRRVEVSQKIYLADMAFDPIIGKTYHLYERKNGKHILTLVSPDEWGRSIPYKSFVATVRLLADHTWDVSDDSKF